MSELPLPQWAYVPGEGHEADADYETLAQVKLLVPPAFRGYVPARHPALRYGILLNDRGYFWEARESWRPCGRPRRKADASAFCCAPAS
jgi:hypothetical protein